MTTALTPIPIPLPDLERMAAAVAKSGLFGMRTVDQALALMLIAQAEGAHPATIAQDYDIIQGRAARKSHSILARFQSAGGRVEWHCLTDERAEATFSHPSGGSLRLDWTIDRAQRAGLAGRDNWRSYQRAMLRSRVIAEGVRAVYPAAIGGLLTVEEAADLPPADVPMTITQSAQPAIERAPELPPYPQAKFDSALPKWRERVAAGGNPEDLIATLRTRYKLTDDQIATIRALAIPAAQTEEGRHEDA